ncbi:MAG: lipopolysaccharide biosynthesis protein, partial [Acidimicrobiia bacterium]
LLTRAGRGWRPVFVGARAELTQLWRSMVGHHLTNLGLMAPMYVLPLLVVARLQVQENAYFYVTWMVCGLFFLVSPSVAASLFAEGSHAEAQLVHTARRAVRVIFLVLAPAIVFFVFEGGRILSVFGHLYESHGRVLLLILVVSSIPDAITNVAVAVLRVRRNFAAAAGLNWLIAASTALLAWVLLPHLGIAGAGLAWLIAQSLGAAVVAGTLVTRTCRTRRFVDRTVPISPGSERPTATAMQEQ